MDLLTREAFVPRPAAPAVPHIHRFCVFSDREAQDSALYISWKVPSRPTCTPAQYVEVLKVRRGGGEQHVHPTAGCPALQQCCMYNSLSTCQRIVDAGFVTNQNSHTSPLLSVPLCVHCLAGRVVYDLPQPAAVPAQSCARAALLCRHHER